MTRLDLSENPMTIYAIRIMADSNTLARLRLLMLSKCGVTSEGLMTLVNSSVMTNLEVLLLPFNLITHIKGFCLEYSSKAEFKHLQRINLRMQLAVLDVRGNPLEGEAYKLFDTFFKKTVIFLWHSKYEISNYF